MDTVTIERNKFYHCKPSHFGEKPENTEVVSHASDIFAKGK